MLSLRGRKGAARWRKGNFGIIHHVGRVPTEESRMNGIPTTSTTLLQSAGDTP